jgi:hypothetical protein
MPTIANGIKLEGSAITSGLLRYELAEPGGRDILETPMSLRGCFWKGPLENFRIRITSRANETPCERLPFHGFGRLRHAPRLSGQNPNQVSVPATCASVVDL